MERPAVFDPALLDEYFAAYARAAAQRDFAERFAAPAANPIPEEIPEQKKPPRFRRGGDSMFSNPSPGVSKHDDPNVSTPPLAPSRSTRP